MTETKDGDSKRNLNLSNKCEVCGEEIQDQHATHCSDKCIFESIKNTKPFRGLKQSHTKNIFKTDVKVTS